MQLRFPNKVTPQTESQLTKHNNNKLTPPKKPKQKTKNPNQNQPHKLFQDFVNKTRG